MKTYYHQILAFTVATICIIGGCLSLRVCVKQADCEHNQSCRMYDHPPATPLMWPSCPHTGICVCKDNNIMLGNGSCLPTVVLYLNDTCTDSPRERYANPEKMRCENSRVVCSWPFVQDERGQQCQAATGTTPSTRVLSTPRRAFSWPSVFTEGEDDYKYSMKSNARPVVYAEYLASCNPLKNVHCDQSGRGLCCLLRGPSAEYMQCQCCDSHYTFDINKNICRPRVYGDLCVNNEDCNSGEISSVGFECRLGRCRCRQGYQAVDNLYWNATGKSTYLRRICIIDSARTSVPTGQSCTMRPEIWAQYNSTQTCHRRAFCYRCFSERMSHIVDHKPSEGICREFACTTNSDCAVPLACNKWSGMLDPPCETGMCDCNAEQASYMDRNSKCSPYRVLTLGDRCLLKRPNGLHHWFQTNEDWQPSHECVQSVSDSHIGVLGCLLPFFEDIDGACFSNNETSDALLLVSKSFGEPCDDADLRQPRVVCDQSKGLFCNRTKRCACTENASQPNNIFWDGSTCRSKKYGDPCRTDRECLTRSYYPPNVVAAQCGEEFKCGCADGFAAVGIGSVVFDNGAKTRTISKATYCFPANVSIVSKGGDCHLDPIGFAEEMVLQPVFSSPILICNVSQRLFCLRCPSEFHPDDESLGICRTYTQLPFGPLEYSINPSTTTTRMNTSDEDIESAQAAQAQAKCSGNSLISVLELTVAMIAAVSGAR